MSAEPIAASECSARSARADDYATFVRLYAELGVDDPPPDESEWTRTLLDRTLFLEHAGSIAAYCKYTVHGHVAHIGHVVVDPAFRARGLGRVLMRACAQRLRAAECTQWQLYVRRETTAAVRLYESVGMHRACEVFVVALPWDRVNDLALPERPIAARDVAPFECEALEQLHALAPHSLSQSMHRDDAGVVQLVTPERPLEYGAGLAHFSITSSRAAAFRAREPGFARVLLDAMRARMKTREAVVWLVVRDDPRLFQELTAVGGAVDRALFEMRGVIPDEL